MRIWDPATGIAVRVTRCWPVAGTAANRLFTKLSGAAPPTQ
jgi:hypothetical protein